MKPYVSICLPAYEQPDLLIRALESIKSQSFQDFEIIVTDDSQSSSIETAIGPWLGDPRMRYVRNAHRLGSPKNWNAAMSLASGILIKILHHDDWLSGSDSLREYVALLDNSPEADFAFSASVTCNVTGKPISIHRPIKEQINALNRDPRCLFATNFIGAPSATIFRRKDSFLFDKNLKWLVDVEAYIRLCGERGIFKYSPNALVNVTAFGPHQITREIEADRVLQFVENIYVYKTLKFEALDRMKYLTHFTQLAKGLSGDQISAVYSDPKVKALPLEVWFSIYLVRFTHFVSGLGNLRKF